MKINTQALIKEDAGWFVAQLRNVKAFSVLSDQDLVELVSQMRSYDFKAGTTLANQGESANLFFIVHEGLVEVSVKKFFFWEKKVATLKAGEFFGESVLVSNSKRTATVKALTDNSCFVLLKASFKSTLNHNSLFKENMKVVFARRKRQLQRT